MAATDNNNIDPSVPDGHDNEPTLEKILSSRKWVKYFQELSKALNIELSVYNPDGVQLFLANENSYCQYNRSAQAEIIDCPTSCNELLQSDEPHIFKCKSRIICFSFPIEKFGEKVFFVGRGRFASYDDLVDFLKIVRDNNLPELPISMPVNYTEEDYMRAVSRYVHLSVSRQLESIEEKNRLEEKFLRITSLFDSQAFRTLSQRPELMYRHILDTIEFVFGRTSASLMVLDREDSVYRTVHSIGTDKDVAMDLSFTSDSPVIKKMSDTKSAMFFEDLDNIMTGGKIEGITSYHFSPLFIGNTIEALIVIFNKEVSREDVKILNAFREYVQLNLEKENFRAAASRYKKADEKLSYLSDITQSIISILDKDRLFKTLLEKSLQLLSAEQGSLMLLDHDTSELVVEARKSGDETVQEKMRFKKGECISGMVLEIGGSLLVEDIEKDPRIKQVNRPHYRTKSFVSVPIKINDRIAGVLNVSDKFKGNVFDKDDVSLIESFIANVAIAIERSLLYKQTEKLLKLSITDPLTGIYNRRYLNRRLSEEITRFNRYKHHFSFMMLDLDKFKEYNDTFGHVAGDNLIKNLANVMEKSLRTIDIAARFGGDEFVAIFPQTPKVDAIQISNRLKEHIEKSLSEYNREMPLTLSVGLATFPDDASSIMELIEKTDQALYLAKKGGGDRVVYL
jgi:diguanylate cyclase (GGDEF)-like protein